MSQVFSGDSVGFSGSITVTTTTETTAITGNFVNPPFQNAKAVVSALVALNPGTASTSVTVRIRRNPNAENVAVVTLGSIPVAPPAFAFLYIQGADAPVGPGPVQYAITVQQTGATGNGAIIYANVTTLLISG